MSDEILNNNDNDDTSALFVSAQKKKKAEEEARRKAEEEQAKRDAAAAEVAKMEQEVEERRIKAEEERLALLKAEEEAKQRKNDLAAKADTSATQEAVRAAVEGTAKKIKDSKIPKLIGLIAGVVVCLAICIAVVLTIIEKNSFHIDDVNVDEKYTSKEADYDIELMYPGELYPEISEEKTDDGISILFEEEKQNGISTKIVISDLVDDDKDKVTRDEAPFYSVKDLKSYLARTSEEQLNKAVDGVNIKDTVECSYSEDDPGAYSITYKFDTDEYYSGSAYAWIEPNSKLDFKVVSVICFSKKEDQVVVEEFRDLVTAKNAKDAFAMPGANPPKATEVDGTLEENTMHMLIHVPEGMFSKWSGSTPTFSVWTDDNGAKIIVQPIDSTIEGDITDSQADVLIDGLKEIADSGVNGMFTTVESRQLISDDISKKGWIGYLAEYQTVMSGVTYWERIRLSLWTDVTTEQKYWAYIITLAPEVNKNDYKVIFDKTMSTLEDM
ncbi:MAG: cell envelope integrity protein TolA [Lachnospiraceae bacterium]|nr:cell envelope integrity protein TolA [Lachnospiraceae bacterium]